MSIDVGRQVNLISFHRDARRPADLSGGATAIRFGVTSVTEAHCRVWQTQDWWGRNTIMKKTALVFALAFAFTTGMAVVTVVAHTGRAMADGAGTIIAYPEQVNACGEGTNC